MSAARVELGRRLFYDRRMSVNGKSSCGTCHRQELAFTDGRAHAQGTTGESHPRGSMSLVNVAYATSLTWINPALTSLEEQALIPMMGDAPVELGLKGHEAALLSALRTDPVYRKLFPEAFPGDADAYTIPNITRAIAAFERSIVSMRSPYDRYRWGGEAQAISESAKRGELIFFSSERGGCFQCHGGWNFSGGVRFEGGASKMMGDGFFNTGVAAFRPGEPAKFRAPTLRNIAITAPYMHDGSMATLEEVVDHYAAGGRNAHPEKSRVLRAFKLTEEDRRDLVEFLRTLTDEELLHDPRWSDPWKR